MIDKFLPSRFIIILSCLVLTACSLFPCKCMSEEVVSNTSNSHSCCNKGNSQNDTGEHQNKDACTSCLIGEPSSAESFLSAAEVKTLGFAPVFILSNVSKHINVALVRIVILQTKIPYISPRFSSDLPTLLHRWLI